ncbi:MAG: TorF family putative porin [Burkholderiaceae bacterium]
MKFLLPTVAAALTLVALPTLVHAEEAQALSVNLGAVSDYRYRGISQTRLKPALQGGADYALGRGFYVGTWLSTIRWIRDWGTDSGVDTGRANLEWDLYAGHKGELGPGLSYDVGVLAYLYPGNHYGRLPGAANANTTELDGALSFGVATLKYSHAVTHLFGTDKSKNSGYLEAAASFDLGSGFSVTPHIGHQLVAHNGNYSSTDYSLTAAKDFNGLVLSVALVGADTKSIAGAKAYASPVDANKDLGKFGVVLGLKKTF